MNQQISPVFHHRVSQHAPTALVNLGSSILSMTARARSVLALVRSQFDASRRLDEETIYYAFDSVDLEFQDINSCQKDFIQAVGVDGQKIEQGVLDAFARIDLELSGARCVIYFLSELFGNEHDDFKDEPILGAIDLLVRQMTEIGEIARNLHTEVRS